jgi:hypothetical protein
MLRLSQMPFNMDISSRRTGGRGPADSARSGMLSTSSIMELDTWRASVAEWTY